MWKNSKIEPVGAIKRIAAFTLAAGLLLTACAADAPRLEGKAVQQGKDLLVTGTSTLPDHALILVALLDPAKPDEMNRNVIVQNFAQVRQGAFEATLKPSRAVPAGKYQLRLRFSPPAPGLQNMEAVLAAVGDKGEKLTGPQVVSDGDVKMLVHQQEIDYRP